MLKSRIHLGALFRGISRHRLKIIVVLVPGRAGMIGTFRQIGVSRAVSHIPSFFILYVNVYLYMPQAE